MIPRLGSLAVAVTLLASLPAPGASEKSNLRLTVETPVNGAVIGDPQGMAFVSGQALALFGDYKTFDIVFVVDTSDSTATPSGEDIDGDGKVGQSGGRGISSIFGRLIPLPSSDPGDSILAAEVAAVANLLQQLDPRTTRVGIVSFAGDYDPLTPDAFTEVPLTSEYELVMKGLARVLRRGPANMTNMVDAINLSMIELLGTQSAYSEPRRDSRPKRIVMFLTDGRPTLPIEGSSLQNAKMAIDHATRARKFDIRIDTFALGPDALSEPISVVEMARVSDGVFTPVKRPADLRAVFEQIDFSEIEALGVSNATTGAEAHYLTQNADGSFAALLDMQEGRNRIEVYARATDGSRMRREITVDFVPGAEAQRLSFREVAQRNRLLEDRLRDLKHRRMELETEREERVRAELLAEIERQRDAAEKKADEMRKRLEIETEPE
ncbi:MAG: VWA domain-containing protein [Proteobacteria bacterium]|nr:VWA domain-containing protein [Pseudomonadota bacterium]